MISRDNCVGEGLWGFLRRVVSDPACQEPMRVRVGELLGIGRGIGMRRTVGVTFKGDRGHRDHGTCRQVLFELVVLRFSIGQAETPAVVVDHHAHVIRIVERLRGPLERRVVESPFRRSDLPNQLRKLVAVFVVPRAAPVRREVVLRTTIRAPPAAAAASC